MQIELGPDILQNYEKASKREWLVTNGIGGYASSSLAGSNTRRYHGLLVAALSPPTGRVVTLSKLEETLFVNDMAFPLSTNQYPGALAPEGFRLLSLFKRYPVPTFLYRPMKDIEIEKSIWMAPGKNTTYIRYTLLRSPKEARIRLLPLAAWIDYHAEFHCREDFPFSVSWQEPELQIIPHAGVSPLRFRLDHARFFSRPDWYYNMEHLRELERGLDFRTDLYSPGYFERDLSPGDSMIFAATVDSSIENGESVLASVVEEQQRLITRAGLSDDFGEMMVLAADQFIVHPPRESRIRATVIAGYPWFTDWGRDTMISLPGLCLSTGRPEIAREILAAFAGFISKGMLPNRFPDAGQDPEYNTVDAVLWYFQAVYSYLNATGDADFVRDELMQTLAEIIAQHISGTRYNIKMDTDGLLNAEAEGVQLTWMDAKVGDYVVTPRSGKAVEINALWYNALRIMAVLAARFGKDDAEYKRMAGRNRSSFVSKFKRPDRRGLFDVIEGPGPQDASIRPNQILSVSLPFSPLDPAGTKEVVDIVQQHLLTPYGLRTLAPGDAAYRGHYGGNQFQRDSAYHQGTVWPWLLGPFVEAHLKVYRDKAAALGFLGPIQGQLSDAGVGSISEIFPGDPPFLPDGCIAQAWSVAEVLRVWKELTVFKEAS